MNNKEYGTNSFHCWKFTLRQRVEFILSMHGKSMKWLADEAGINKGTLSKIINKHWNPTVKIKLLMGEKLGCDSLVLFGDDINYMDNNKFISART